MSSTLLAKQAWNPETDELDLGALFPALRQYCPILYGHPSIHDHPQQCLFLLLDCEEAFYGGAAGGGKSAALLAGALQYVDVPGYRAAILRRTYTQLSKGDALIPLSHEWLGPTDAKWNEQKKAWTFPSGATLEFGHVKDESAKFDYQGAAYHYLAFDELTQFPQAVYEYISFSRQRRRTSMANLGIPIRVRSGANPGGIGHGWVRKRFVQRADPSRPFIKARVRDNPGLDAEDYAQRLSKLNPTLAAQLLDGDWDAFEGMAYTDFSDELHVVDPFEIPNDWKREESMDFGSSNPTAWLARAVDFDGNQVVFDEYYSPGLVTDHVAEIRRRRGWWWAKDDEGRPIAATCFADPSIANKTGVTSRGRALSVEIEFNDNGFGFALGQNDRRLGHIRIAELLRPDPARYFPYWHPRAGELGAPRLYFFKGCTNVIQQLQDAPLEEEGKPLFGEAVDRDWEGQHGHAHAALRYGVTSRTRASVEPEKEPDDPRTQRLLAIRKRRAEEHEDFERFD